MVTIPVVAGSRGSTDDGDIPAEGKQRTSAVGTRIFNRAPVHHG